MFRMDFNNLTPTTNITCPHCKDKITFNGLFIPQKCTRCRGEWPDALTFKSSDIRNAFARQKEALHYHIHDKFKVNS